MSPHVINYKHTQTPFEILYILMYTKMTKSCTLPSIKSVATVGLEGEYCIDVKVYI